MLARRLVERGVRFIEVSHNLNFLNGTGWDVHNAGIVHQHELIRELDSAMSALIVDLEAGRTTTLGNVLCTGGETWKFTPAAPRRAVARKPPAA